MSSAWLALATGGQSQLGWLRFSLAESTDDQTSKNISAKIKHAGIDIDPSSTVAHTAIIGISLALAALIFNFNLHSKRLTQTNGIELLML